MRRDLVNGPNLQLITGIHTKPMALKAALPINLTPHCRYGSREPTRLWDLDICHSENHLGDSRDVEEPSAHIPFTPSLEEYLGVQKLAVSGYPIFHECILCKVRSSDTPNLG